MLDKATKHYLPVIDYFCNQHPEFVLVGDTALALQKKHRTSVDFDLFTSGDFDAEQIRLDFYAAHRDIASKFTSTPELRLTGKQTDQIHFLVAGTINVTLLRYHYPIKSTKKQDRIKLATLSAIFAMKLFAILQRVDYKDFYDIAILLKTFTLKQGLGFFNKMIQPEAIDPKLIIAHLAQIRTLVTGAEQSILNAQINRREVASRIEKAIKDTISF